MFEFFTNPFEKALFNNGKIVISLRGFNFQTLR